MDRREMKRRLKTALADFAMLNAESFVYRFFVDADIEDPSNAQINRLVSILSDLSSDNT
jgi:hypothetical protein